MNSVLLQQPGRGLGDGRWWRCVHKMHHFYYKVHHFYYEIYHFYYRTHHVYYKSIRFTTQSITFTTKSIISRSASRCGTRQLRRAFVNLLKIIIFCTKIIILYSKSIIYDTKFIRFIANRYRHLPWGHVDLYLGAHNDWAGGQHDPAECAIKLMNFVFKMMRIQCKRPGWARMGQHKQHKTIQKRHKTIQKRYKNTHRTTKGPIPQSSPSLKNTINMAFQT